MRGASGKRVLPDGWVDRIMARMSARYGSQWAAKWVGVDMQLVRADWAEQLAGFDAHPEAIRYALDNLPAERPPNVTEFRRIANQAPPPPVAGLLTNQPARRPPPPEVAEKLRAFIARTKGMKA